jgi:beta-glucosidase
VPRDLPPDFVWGTTSSAYQIEGARAEDGKGDSIWDRFADLNRMPDSGDVACDHYHRWRDDVALMAGLGLKAYQFSIAWTRVLPGGTGEINPAGLGFYDRLVDELLEHGIAPWVNLYHWDLPQALQDTGGWPERSTVEAFVRYADVVSRSLGDRVDAWVTHSEPWVAAYLGHLEGIFAPGIRDWGAALAAGHHLLLSHGRAVPIIRANAPGSQVGISLDCRPSRSASDDPADLEAQRHFDGFRNRWFFDPVFGMGYPDDIVADYRHRGRFDPGGPSWLLSGDLDEIAAPIDFLGLNYYTSLEIAAGADEAEDSGTPPGADPPPGYTEMGWPITPGDLTAFLERINTEYRPESIFVTENGASYGDGPGPDGVIRDDRRIDYLRQHIGAVLDAIEAGVPVNGYFVWSLLDNLEWVAGFSQRFGLVWVDHSTQRRIPKESYRWYRDVIAGNALA